jgi:hypothetical protein
VRSSSVRLPGRELGILGLWIAEFDFGREDEPDVIKFAAVWWLNLNHNTYLTPLLVRSGNNCATAGCVRRLVPAHAVPAEHATIRTWMASSSESLTPAGNCGAARSRCRRWTERRPPAADIKCMLTLRTSTSRCHRTRVRDCGGARSAGCVRPT